MKHLSTLLIGLVFILGFGATQSFAQKKEKLKSIIVVEVQVKGRETEEVFTRDFQIPIRENLAGKMENKIGIMVVTVRLHQLPGGKGEFTQIPPNYHATLDAKKITQNESEIELIARIDDNNESQVYCLNEKFLVSRFQKIEKQLNQVVKIVAYYDLVKTEVYENLLKNYKKNRFIKEYVNKCQQKN